MGVGPADPEPAGGIGGSFWGIHDASGRTGRVRGKAAARPRSVEPGPTAKTRRKDHADELETTPRRARGSLGSSWPRRKTARPNCRSSLTRLPPSTATPSNATPSDNGDLETFSAAMKWLWTIFASSATRTRASKSNSPSRENGTPRGRAGPERGPRLGSSEASDPRGTGNRK